MPLNPQVKMLVIFNICQIKFQNYKKENSGQIEYWIRTIESLLNQNYQNHTIVVSGCKLRPESKATLRAKFGNKIYYNFIDDVYTVNITFNKTIEKMIEKYGEYDGYVWVDSGVHCEGQPNVLAEINTRAQTGKYGIIMIETETDQGWDMVFGQGVTSYDFKGEDFIQPIGTLLAPHFWYFSNDFRKAYGSIFPDVFRIGGAEFVFPYMCYAMHTKPVVIKDLKIHHALGFDGSSSGFPQSITIPGQCDFLHGLTLQDVLVKDKMMELGMGYDDLAWGPHYESFVPHNKDMFDAEGFAIKDEEMRNYIKEHFYLSPAKFDYSTVHCEVS